jgi:magnesium chelatase accessory protein
MSGKPQWSIEGRDWPNAQASRFVMAGRLRWHVQEAGAGPAMLLLHGSGAATHSWAGLLPLLAKSFRILAPDLPGHGFTGTPPGFRLSLDDMARDLGALLAAEAFTPQIVVGHSAGAAIAARMAVRSIIDPKLIVSLNGAFLPFPGLAGKLFPGMAKLIFLNPLAPRLFALRAGDRGVVDRLIRSTGSRPEATQVEGYARLIRTPGHVAGALGMMANWDLEPLQAELRRLATPLVLIACENDLAIPPSVADTVARMAPHAEVVHVPHLGHLGHEEDPDLFAGLIVTAARAQGLV